jgi:hypothetical protein
MFYSENLPFTVLYCLFEFYKNLEVGLTLFGCNMQVMKEIRKEKEKRRNKNRNRPGAPFWPNPA